MANAYDIIGPSLANGLLNSPSTRREALDVLCDVSGDPMPLVGFERTLMNGRDVADVFLGFDAQDPELLERYTRSHPRRLASAGGTDMPGLAAFARRWAGDSGLQASVQNVWLEFDARPNPRARYAPPGIFLGRGADLGGGTDALLWAEERLAEVGQISGHELPCGVHQRTSACLAHLPDGALPKSIGFFLGRPHEGIRLCIDGLDPGTAAPFLSRIGYPGRVEAFGEESSQMAAAAEGILGGMGMLHLDVGTRVGPRVGVEFVFEFKRQHAEWRLGTSLLADLAERGLVSWERAEALTLWPGAFFAGGPPRRVFLRRVNHLKAVFESDRVVEVKAYFGIRDRLPLFFQGTDRCAANDT